MKMKLSWHNEKRKLSELVEFDKNPRILTEKAKKDLKSSLTKFGLAEVPAIDTDNKIVAGHQRISILKELEGDQEIDVRVPNRKLTQKEFEEYNIRSNKNAGEWSTELLGTFTREDLIDWGFEKWETIGIFGINDLEAKYHDKDKNFENLDMTKFAKTNMIWINDIIIEFEDEELKEATNNFKKEDVENIQREIIDLLKRTGKSNWIVK